jgi:lipoprotein NlpD
MFLGLMPALSGCADHSRTLGPQVHVVAPGDTLYSIAWRHDLDYRDLATWNNIGPDFHISVGQRLLLRPNGVVAPNPALAPKPALGGKSASTLKSAPSHKPAQPSNAAQASNPAQASNAAQASDAAPASNSVPTSRSTQTSKPWTAAAPSAASDAPQLGPTNWLWPTDRISNPRPVTGGGILIAGRLGQDVRAAAAGRVVYAGSGLRSYGKLIIIKHGETLLSAYAHNRELLVREGQEVAAGQSIGRMGEGAPRSPTLYFEIRLNGRPVDPLAYLSGKK